MIDYVGIRTLIGSELYKYMNIPVIMSDQPGDKPSYPYIGYKIITPYIRKSYSPHETVIKENGQAFLLVQTQPKMTISINAYDKSIDGATQRALQAHEWFSYLGRNRLKDSSVVVVETRDLENRDIVLEDVQYERRVGFDVTLRVNDILKVPIEEFESVEINNMTIRSDDNAIK
ncbi:phage neck terminator protein [Desertibacillus haloalkaliphilus]|uniref:phage neck terminator protein n=1 Tax=Desertibacillus haloalkaliphilus TaxID=1328930 RepID=UPI001C26CDED|nr:hypothetical protein [Desertibacillus haloalkaliphilus]MBU8908506.1 hypothetical protein [Desertibacillus haloalkaliphilus]